jgi:hypothetical protein
MTPRPTGLPPDRPLRVPGERRAPAWAISIAVLGAATYVVLFVIAIIDADGELLHALTIAPILILLTVPIAVRIARAEGDPRLAMIVMVGLVAKLLAALVRYYVAFVVYHGGTDAAKYDETARQLAPDFRRFIFTTDIGKIIGTGFGRILTGIVYAIFGAGTIGGFLVFSWLGFLGLLLFARAFRIGVPDGDGRRYLLLVLFLPSLLYWPSAIGKEAWMMLGLGLCSYGIACLFRRRSSGALVLALGLFAVLMMRPHLSLILFVGLVFALLVRRAPARNYAAPLFRVLALGALLALGLFLASQTASFLGQESLTAESVNVELSQTETQTGEGGSAFTPVKVTTPFHMVPAFVTVFFRPFVFETGNPQGLLTAAEGVLLFGLCVASRKRLRAIPRLVRSTPYVAFCVGYVLAFVFAFSSFGNFGILARQRVQALPLLLALLAIPPFRAAVAAPSDPETKAVEQPPIGPGPARRRRPRRPPGGTPDQRTAVEVIDVVGVAREAPAPGAPVSSRRRPRPPGSAHRQPVSAGAAVPPPPRVRR